MDLGTSDCTDVRLEQRGFMVVATASAVVAAFATLDLVADLREGTTLQHALIEAVIATAAVIGVAFGVSRVIALRQRTRRAELQASELAERLRDSRSESERWRAEARELLEGLGTMIDRQFVRWGLSQAEQDIALFMLKGFSHREIAQLRSVGEATVRQQATSIYKKAGVAGRHDLSAFFLEDLLAPKLHNDPSDPTVAPA